MTPLYDQLKRKIDKGEFDNDPRKQDRFSKELLIQKEHGHLSELETYYLNLYLLKRSKPETELPEEPTD